MKSKDTYIDVDFIEQDTGSIIYHRRFKIDPENKYTYQKTFQDITDSLVRSSEKGDYTVMFSVSRPIRQMQTLNLF